MGCLVNTMYLHTIVLYSTYTVLVHHNRSDCNIKRLMLQMNENTARSIKEKYFEIEISIASTHNYLCIFYLKLR